MNEKERSGRARLKEALEQYDKEFFDQFPTCEENIHISQKHLKKMNHILRKSQSTWLKRLGTIGKCAAVFAIVLLIVCKNDIFTYGEHKFTSTLYSYTNEGLHEITWYKFLPDDDSAPKFLNTLFEPTYIPEGFELVEQKTQRYYAKNHSYWFENAAGEDIWFTQTTLSHGVGYNTSIRTVEILQVRDFEVLYVSGGEGNIDLFWSNYGYTFKLNLPCGFTKDECMKIFDSIQKVRE